METHLSEMIRYADQELAEGHMVEALVDQQPAQSRPALCVSALASSIEDDSVSPLGAEAIAEVNFPLDLGDVGTFVQHVVALGAPALRIVVHQGIERLPKRQVVAIWARLSKAVVGRGAKSITVVLPLDGRLLTVAGLFGCPRRVGDRADDQWSVKTCVTTTYSVELTLRRRAAEPEERRLGIVRNTGIHLTSRCQPIGARFQATVFGLINHVDGRREAVIVRGPKLPNPSSAVAEALAAALERTDGKLPATLWLADGLVRSAVSGHFGKGAATPYKGVRPPDMQRALNRLRRACRVCAAGVDTKHANRGGAVANELASRALARLAVDSMWSGLGLAEVGRNFICGKAKLPSPTRALTS